MRKHKCSRLAAQSVVWIFCFAVSGLSQGPSPSPSPRSAPAARKTFKVQVEVTSGAEKIPNARVSIHSQEEGVRFSKQKRTNKQGIASATAVPQGRIKVVVLADDCATFGEVFTLSQDNQTFRVALTKNAPSRPSP